MAQAKLIIVRPVDITGLPNVGVAIPTPSIEHSIKPCDQCGRDCWVGPTQLFHKTMTGATMLCYFCCGAPYMAFDPEIIALDASADQKPRRT